MIIFCPVDDVVVAVAIPAFCSVVDVDGTLSIFCPVPTDVAAVAVTVAVAVAVPVLCPENNSA